MKDDRKEKLNSKLVNSQPEHVWLNEMQNFRTNRIKNIFLLAICLSEIGMTFSIVFQVLYAIPGIYNTTWLKKYYFGEKKQIGKALEISVKAINEACICRLLEESPLEVNIFNISGCDGWRVLDKLDIQDLDQQDTDQNTMLHYAGERNMSATVRYLIERGANTNIQNTYGNTPLLLAAKSTSENKDERLVLSTLIENSDINIINPDLDQFSDR
ncbi:hypothetical protein LOD99_2859 [Oopsacas minuta]|uniref:Uncharacterized protein n=1 Tax=Oopsacas minuta TaxID=111878 RepID=A0AAV7JYP3_9METZ|nr:hypothetical protein LOD99_2859 [Oopsacas minuta]